MDVVRIDEIVKFCKVRILLIRIEVARNILFIFHTYCIFIFAITFLLKGKTFSVFGD